MFILSARRDLGFAGLSRHGAPAGSCGLSARLLSARFSTISSEHVQIEGDACGTWPALASCERKRRQQVHLAGVAGLQQVRGGHGHQWSCHRHWQQVWGIDIITDVVVDAREAPCSKRLLSHPSARYLVSSPNTSIQAFRSIVQHIEKKSRKINNTQQWQAQNKRKAQVVLLDGRRSRRLTALWQQRLR